LKCEKCGIHLTEGINFCSECGTPVPKPQPKVQDIQGKREFPPILTVDLAAEFLCVTRCHIYTLIKTDGLPWFQMGKSKRFITDELINWAKSRQVVQQAV